MALKTIRVPDEKVGRLQGWLKERRWKRALREAWKTQGTYSDLLRELESPRGGYTPKFYLWNLEGVSARGVGAQEVTFLGANLCSVDFREAEFPDASFRKSVMRGVDFTAADLFCSLFDRCDLRGARFVDADLSGADFSESDLTDVDFEGADMTGVDLEGATYRPEQLLGARYLDPRREAHGIPDETWDQILPREPGAEKLLGQVIVRDDYYGMPLREVIAATQRLLPADPETQELLFSLLEDWEGTVEDAAATAQLLRDA